MEKHYVIEGAAISCQYGEGVCRLLPYRDRHIYAGGRLMANQSDISGENLEGSLGACRSPYVLDYSGEIREVIRNIQQLAPFGEGLPACRLEILLSWQETAGRVHIGPEEYGALLEDGWTVCNYGLGILTLTETGQEEEDCNRLVAARLEELEGILDAYMKANGLGKGKRAALLESVLLWNGYLPWDMPWEVRSSREGRAFCSYLEKEHPGLFSYFERGIYIRDREGEPIDLTYLMGMNKALGSGRGRYDPIAGGMPWDRAMYNAYLESFRGEPGQDCSQAARDAICRAAGPEAGERYSHWLNRPDQAARDSYYEGREYARADRSREEQNREVVKWVVSQSMWDYTSSDADTGDGIVQERQEQAEAMAEVFVRQVEKDRDEKRRERQ